MSEEIKVSYLTLDATVSTAYVSIDEDNAPDEAWGEDKYSDRPVKLTWSSEDERWVEHR